MGLSCISQRQAFAISAAGVGREFAVHGALDLVLRTYL